MPVLRGSCGEKIGRALDVEAEDVVIAGRKLEGVRIRWLIRDSDGARAFAMRYFTMEPGSHIPGHKHPWEHEIFVIKGSMKVRIGSNTYDVGEGSFIFIPPNVEHEYWAGSEGAHFLCLIPLKPTVDENYDPCSQA
ncbi:cupin domain-containing protein [Hyperthermus butylicus]|uniref:Cupin type-2 domain-containing protein n=1 Tax=Hyperthermus butylicus (strain DSM 5456 / JCM 9403 / PLM1-5) TaxID=415426 RepID=A2BIZ6_HYPBU|nr:cupin domain-containing protein [Hyperthermus butylicus]ABM79957.1 hypothetical protein Hbut_0081 [Hyperthermus butylicus DSM 5456]